MKTLQILLVARGEMTSVFGTHKVHLELKEEYEKHGHRVDILDYSKIYSTGETAAHRIFGRLYTYRFWKYLQKNAAQYDVIDANSECIVYSKESFGFKGVLLVRSHGIRPIYDEAEKVAGFQKAIAAEKAGIRFKTRIGNIYRGLQKQPGYREFWASVQHADVVHCLNLTEYDFFIKHNVPATKLLLVPNGLTDSRIKQFNTVSNTRVANRAVFIASWTIRKGIKDLSTIFHLVNKKVDVAGLRLIGGHTASEKVKTEFDTEQHPLLEIVSQFAADELLNHLRGCKVGVFPSYIEGFGLAVVEQIAAGVPVVAYDVPGPNGILQDVDSTLLIPPGDLQAFAAKVASILAMDETAYLALSNKCKKASQKYLLSNVAIQFLDRFYSKLSNAVSKK